MKLVSFDPGLREAGAAVFEDGRLVECMALYADTGEGGAPQWVAMANVVTTRLRGADEFVFELMQTRQGRESSHAALIDLSIISGMCCGMMRPATCRAVPANTWTHGRKKAVNAKLVEHQLDPDERAVLAAALKATKKANHKEITDAVGIGLYALRRWL